MVIKNDFVETPKEITKLLLNNEKFEGNILEPCCGNGAISEILKKEGYKVISSDLNEYGYGEIKDVFDIKEEYDNIITNPPFSIKLAIPIQRYLFSKTKKKLVLLWFLKNVGQMLEGKSIEGLKYVYIIGKVNWIETKLGWKFAWYVWEKGYKGDVMIKNLNSQNKPEASS